MQDFIVFTAPPPPPPPGHSLKNRMQFGPAQNKMYLITQWTVYRCNHKHARIQEFSSGSGGPGQSDKKNSDNVFFSPPLIFQKSNGQFQRNLSFFKVPEGSNISRGVQLFQGGVHQLLIPYRTHITCDFTGGSGPPVPPLWIHT